MITRRFDGRSEDDGFGEGSREGSDDVSPPPKRRLRKDMAAREQAEADFQSEVCYENVLHEGSSSTCRSKTSERAGSHVMQ